MLASEIDQTLEVVLPPGMAVERLTANGKSLPVIAQGVRKQGCRLALPRGDAVTLEARFHPDH